MRIVTLIAIAITFLAVGSVVLAQETTSQEDLNLYAAGACAAPGYGTQPLRPGCCECKSTCCDDVWAGYCEKKKQGFALPCIRPFCPCAPLPQRGCSTCPGMIYDSPPRTNLAPLPAPPSDKESVKAPQKKNVAPLPTPAPKLPAPPAAPKSAPKSKESESKSSDSTTSAPFPVFNPAAWRIVIPLK